MHKDGGVPRSHSFPVIDGKLNPTIHINQGTTKNKIPKENKAENMEGLVQVALSSPNAGRNVSIVECEVHARPFAIKTASPDSISSNFIKASSPNKPTSKDSVCIVTDISMQSSSFNTKSTSWPSKKCDIGAEGDLGDSRVSGSSPNLDKNMTRVNLKHNKASKQIMISATNTFFPYITVPKNTEAILQNQM